MSGGQPRTVEELQDALEAMGRPRDYVGRAEDPQARRDEDATLVRQLPDGRVEVQIMGRGDVRVSKEFGSEQDAVADVAKDLLAPPLPVSRTRTPEERRADGERAQAMAKKRLRELDDLARSQKRPWWRSGPREGQQ